MSVSSTTTKVSYSGDNTTAVFAYTFKIFTASDLEVIIRSSAGAETIKTLTTHYTVSGAGLDAGGNVTFTAGNIPATGETVVIRRNLTLTQGTDYVENDPFPANSHEDALDRLTFITQGIQEELDRAIKASKTNTIGDSEFTVSAADRANKVFAFDSAGDLSVTQELGTFQGDWAAATAYKERDIVKDTSNNNIYLCNTSHTSSGAQPLSSNADSAKWDLLVDAASATTSASAAATSATAAAASATAAATSATNAASSETNAATSETNASNSASAASSSASAASSSASAASSSASAAATSETNAATSEANVEAVTTGISFTFNATTAMADPGAGVFRMNNATVASVTAIAFDATSAETGNPDVSDWIAAWDDISNATGGGVLTIKKAGTPATYAAFYVTAVTDNTGWLQATVTHIASNGTWTASDRAFMQFAASGADGSGALSNVVEDTTPQLGGNLDVNSKSIVFPSVTVSDVLDEDAMGSDSATKLATQQSIKAYVDASVAAATDQTARDNTYVNAFDIARIDSLAQYAMVNSVIEVFTDETGVDTGTSTNELYNAAGDYYSPSPNYTLINNTTDAPAANYSANLGVWTGDTTYYTRLVDEDTNTGYHSASQGQTGYIQFQVSTGLAAVKCEMYFNTNISVNQYTQFLFQGSNNGSSWTTLYTDNAPPTTAGAYTASWSNTTTYTYYRWTATWGYTSYYLNSISEMRWYAEGNPLNMTLVSSAITAASAPTSLRTVIDHKAVDTVTLNTDATIEVTRDGGTTWSAGTLSQVRDAGSGRQVLAATVDVSGQPSGTSVKWRFKTLNTKEQQLHGIAVQADVQLTV